MARVKSEVRDPPCQNPVQQSISWTGMHFCLLFESVTPKSLPILLNLQFTVAGPANNIHPTRFVPCTVQVQSICTRTPLCSRPRLARPDPRSLQGPHHLRRRLDNTTLAVLRITIRELFRLQTITIRLHPDRLAQSFIRVTTRSTCPTSTLEPHS